MSVKLKLIMRISFYNGGVIMAVLALTHSTVHGISIQEESPEGYELAQLSIGEEFPESDSEMMLAQTSAEAQYFKKIVNFAKDAIKTIAPTLSTQNKLNAAAGVVRPLDNDINNKYTLGSGKPGLSKSMEHLGHNLRHPKHQSAIS